jgi:hypothetical protein
MLLLIGLFAVYFFIFLPFGWLGFKMLRIPHNQNLFWLVGLGVTLVSYPLYFFHFLSGSKHYIVSFTFLVSGLIWLIKYKRTFKFLSFVTTNWSWKTMGYSLLFLVIVTTYAALPSNLLDDGIYYSQSIQWFEKYGFIKGLGNFDHNLAQASALHALESAFNFHFLGYRFNDLVGFLLFVAGFQVIIDRKKFKMIQLLIFAFVGLILLHFISAPNPDAFLVVFIFLFVWLLKENQEHINLKWLALIILILFVTIKLSALLLLFYLPFLFHRENAIELVNVRLGFFAGTGVLIFVFFKSFWLTGYPLFPFFKLTPFPVAWNMPPEFFYFGAKASELSAYLSPAPSLIDDPLNGILFRIKTLLNPFNSRGLILIFCIICALSGLFFIIKGKLDRQPRVLLLAALSSIVFILFFSPQARLVLPYALLILFVLTWFDCLKISISTHWMILPVLIGVISLFVPWQIFNTFFSTKALTSYKNIQKEFLVTPHFGWDNVPLNPVYFSEITFFRPLDETYFCFHSGFPCTTHFVKDYIHSTKMFVPVKLGENFSEGFGYEALPYDSTKISQLNSRVDGVIQVYNQSHRD